MGTWWLVWAHWYNTEFSSHGKIFKYHSGLGYLGVGAICSLPHSPPWCFEITHFFTICMCWGCFIHFPFLVWYRPSCSPILTEVVKCQLHASFAPAGVPAHSPDPAGAFLHNSRMYVPKDMQLTPLLALWSHYHALGHQLHLLLGWGYGFVLFFKFSYTHICRSSPSFYRWWKGFLEDAWLINDQVKIEPQCSNSDTKARS